MGEKKKDGGGGGTGGRGGKQKGDRTSAKGEAWRVPETEPGSGCKTHGLLLTWGGKNVRGGGGGRGGDPIQTIFWGVSKKKKTNQSTWTLGLIAFSSVLSQRMAKKEKKEGIDGTARGGHIRLGRQRHMVNHTEGLLKYVPTRDNAHWVLRRRRKKEGFKTEKELGKVFVSGKAGEGGSNLVATWTAIHKHASSRKKMKKYTWGSVQEGSKGKEKLV